MRRLRILAIALLSCFVCGCVEGELVYTLNPDGSGKVEMDLTSAPKVLSLELNKDDPDEMARKMLVNELTGPGSRGLSGWSNVRGEFTKDGRFRFRATAYFKRLEDVKGDMFDKLRLIRGADGSLTLLPDKREQRPGTKKEPPPNFAKMTDAEWARFLLRQRITGQAMKPLFTSFMADVKVKATFRMPGEVTAIKGFKPLGKDGAMFELDGNAVIKEFNRRLSHTDAELRKQYLEGKGPDFDEESGMESLLFGTPVSVTVAKPGAPVFDYAKAVAAAVAGNAELRKKYSIPEDQKLPGEAGFGKGPME
ncbi:MAG: hypothetical protein EXS09_03215 [Gemmataceae bacterium]|nr:hypothetical protein [Gemmataceae bacterium]